MFLETLAELGHRVAPSWADPGSPLESQNACSPPPPPPGSCPWRPCEQWPPKCASDPGYCPQGAPACRGGASQGGGLIRCFSGFDRSTPAAGPGWGEAPGLQTAQPVRGYGMGRVTSPSCVSIPWCWRLGATGLVIHVPRDGGGGVFQAFSTLFLRKGCGERGALQAGRHRPL